MTTGFISADSHVTEPIELYADGVAAEFRDRVPRIRDVDGWRTLHAIVAFSPREPSRLPNGSSAAMVCSR